MKTIPQENSEKLAVIYTRVSTDKQKIKGTGLETQEKLCFEKAEELGYTVLKVFSDAGISGKSIQNRPDMLNLLKFLEREKKPITVFTYDMDRLARDAGDFITIRTVIHTHNHELFTIKDGLIGKDSTSNLISTVVSATGQCEREKNAEKSLRHMKEILSEGHWILQTPAGYTKYMKKNTSKYRWLIRTEPIATIIQQALEKFATAELQTQTDVANFLKDEYKKNNILENKNWYDFAKRILTEEKYAGYYEYKPWGIPYQKGYIETLISLETFKTIQQRLKGKERVKHTIYNKNDERFPLRGQILCPFCHKPITGSLTKSGTFAYYQCQNSQCTSRKQVNVRPDIIHKDFEEFLETIKPTEETINLAKDISLDLYNKQIKDIESANHVKILRLQKIDKEIQDAFIGYDRTNNDTIKQMYEGKIEDLNKEKLTLLEEIKEFETIPQISFSRAFDIVMNTISNPLKIWQDADLQTRRTMCDILFMEKPYYDKNKKFQNIKLMPVFHQINIIGNERNSKLVSFYSSMVPNFKNNSKNLIIGPTKSGTIIFPQNFKGYNKKIVGNSYLVP